MTEEQKELRKRDAEATRQIILEAARRVFTEKGYDQAGTREIANRAGVNIALINRYFGSKEGLFREAVIACLTLPSNLPSDTDGISDLLVQMLINKPEEIGFDPIIAMLRSASSETVGKELRETLNDSLIKQFAEKIGGHDGRERAIMTIALVAGYDVIVRMMQIDLTSDETRDRLQGRINAMFLAAFKAP